MLSKNVQENGSDWDAHLPYLMFVYREVPHSTTCVSPYQLVYGRLPNGPLKLMEDVWTGNREIPTGCSKSIEKYLGDLTEKLKQAHALAREYSERTRADYANRYNLRASEKSLSKNITQEHEEEGKCYQAQQKSEYKYFKDRLKREISGDASSSQRDDAIRNHRVLQHQTASLQRFQREQGDFHRLENWKFRRRKLLQYLQMEQNLLRDKLNKWQSQLEQAHSMLLLSHDMTQKLEYCQQRAVHQLREEHVRKQHQTELANQKEYKERKEEKLHRKHTCLAQNYKREEIPAAFFSKKLTPTQMKWSTIEREVFCVLEAL